MRSNRESLCSRFCAGWLDPFRLRGIEPLGQLDLAARGRVESQSQQLVFELLDRELGLAALARLGRAQALDTQSSRLDPLKPLMVEHDAHLLHVERMQKRLERLDY